MFDAHAPALLGMFRRLCGDPHDVDEAFQETALRVWRHIEQAPWLRSPRAWLLTVGYRVLVDVRRRCPAASGVEELTDSSSGAAETLAEQRELHELAQTLISKLPVALRDVVVLHYTAGLSLRETAAALDLPQGTVKTRLHQALTLLRKEMK